MNIRKMAKCHPEPNQAHMKFIETNTNSLRLGTQNFTDREQTTF